MQTINRSQVWSFLMIVYMQLSLAAFDQSPLNILDKYCSDCHGQKKQKADLNLSTLDKDIAFGDDFEMWRLVYDKIKYKEMPPEEGDELPDSERAKILQSLRNGFLKSQKAGVVTDRKLLLPEFGNYVDHDELFNSKAGTVIPATPSIWRLRPELYDSLVNSIANKPQGLSQPFALMPGFDFKDFSSPYFIDEPTTELLLKNAEAIVENQLSFKLDKNGVKKGKYNEFLAISDPDSPVDEKDVFNAIKREFQLALQRFPSNHELQRFSALWIKVKNDSDKVTATKSMLMAILMQPEVLFRLEVGDGKVDQFGRFRLSQKSIAKAISFALGNKLDNSLLQAAEKRELKDKQVLEKQIQRLFSDRKFQPVRIYTFFEEYFGYKRAIDVFKDRPERGVHDPKILVSDLEHLIKYIVDKDENVLANLLTTNRYFVNYKYDSKKKTGSRFYTKGSYETVYGLPPDWKWTDRQPVELPKDERAGVLTHPAWLVAWSENFHNDPIRRGKWIRTRLLGGSVPDVPISVDAKLSDDEKLTLRSRLNDATDKAKCMGCHSKMNSLGLPFEQYDHYGLYRKLELQKPVDTSGKIIYSDDVNIEGNVLNPVDLAHKLAGSVKVEQVFIRHVFRFFMGRNETLGDAKTLQDAQKAYRKSGGSYKALITSLLTSDSFLYRTQIKEGK